MRLLSPIRGADRLTDTDASATTDASDPRDMSADPASTVVDTDRLTAAVESAGRWAWAGRIGTAPLRHGWLNVTHEGLANIPAEGGVVLAANHLAFIDSILLMYGYDREVAFLGKSEYLDHPVARHLFPATGMLPLDRSGRHARITLDRAVEILRDGGIVGVHPEGTRSRDGLLGPGHKGVAQLALRAGVPVVPVGLIGTGEVQPPGTRLPRFRGRVTIRFGAPIGLGRWSAKPRSARARAELTDEIMREIAALSGQARRDAEPGAADVTSRDEAVALP